MLNEQTTSPQDGNNKNLEPPINQEPVAENEPNIEETNQPDSTIEKPDSEEQKTDDDSKELFEGKAEQDAASIDIDQIIDIRDLADEDEYTPEERDRWESRYAETMKIFQSGELVQGKIIAINEGDITVDIGFKSEGNIPLEEFDHPEQLKVGDEIEVCIDNVEDSEGTLVLSKKKAEFYRVWEKINNLYQTGQMVEAQIIKRIKGGMVVDLFGVEAFLPGSQIDVHPVRDFDAIVGATMDFRIIKVNNARKNVVLSHKVLVEESLLEIREKVLSELEEGQVVEGVVKNITDFGVFVDLGGVDGLLHITDLSWGRVSHPSDMVKLDEKITVKVLHYDKDRHRISLGLKQLKEHHWEEIEERYPVDSKFRGTVVSIVRYGAFVELEAGVEGLVHISEMSWTQHIKHPSQLVNVGDEIDVVILNIDRENRKISLGMKQVEEDPWERLEKVFLPNTRHTGTVRDLVPFGAFVELEPGIDGLIHISDLSWTRKVRHPGEIVKKGQEIEVVILNFDKNERRIALGFKQLSEDPWDDFEKEYPIRSRTEGSVIRVLEKGVVVMLPLGVEGFVPNSQLGKSISGENKKKIKEGDNLELEIIEFDKANHRIVLSHSMVERSKDQAVYRAYHDTPDEPKTTLGDLLRKTGRADSDEKTPQAKKPRKARTETKSKPEDIFAADKPTDESEDIDSGPEKELADTETKTEQPVDDHPENEPGVEDTETRTAGEESGSDTGVVDSKSGDTEAVPINEPAEEKPDPAPQFDTDGTVAGSETMKTEESETDVAEETADPGEEKTDEVEASATVDAEPDGVSEKDEEVDKKKESEETPASGENPDDEQVSSDNSENTEKDS